MTNKVLTQDEIDTQAADYELARSEGRVLFMKCQENGRTIQEIFYDVDTQEWFHNHQDWVCVYVYDGETIVNQFKIKPSIKEMKL